MELTILKWNKYNPRKDIKHPSWFALSNRFLEDPDLFGFEPIDLKAMLYLFCQASQRNSPDITVNFSHAERVCLIKSKNLKAAIEKLSKIGAVRICTDHERARTQTSRDNTDNTDRQTNTTDDFKNRVAEEEAPEFDFESLYRTYPRKEGKAEGMTRLRKRIKSQDEFDSFAKAVRKYASICKLENRDKKFQLKWSSFVGAEGGERWLDYADSSATPAPSPLPDGVVTPPSQSSFQSEASQLHGQASEEMRERLRSFSLGKAGA